MDRIWVMSDRLKKFVLYSSVLLLLVAGCTPLRAEVDTLRIATYNLLLFPDSQGQQRVPFFRTVLRAIDPDILVVQELLSKTGQDLMLHEVLNADTANIYEAVPYDSDPYVDNGLFYKKNRVTFLSRGQLSTDLRKITEYRLQANGIRFFLYAVHFKAGQGYEQMRLHEATVLRNRLNILPDNSFCIVAGDFNIYTSSEPGFIRLTEDQPGNEGNLNDPIQRPGDWHNNRNFAAIHTQSTRTNSFGEGSAGGLDDRFDLILVSRSVLQAGGVEILPQFYTSFGNDGRHLNASINASMNYAVPDSIADALYYASDHLPVFADFVVGTISTVTDSGMIPEQFVFHSNYPNPFNNETTFSFDFTTPATVQIAIYDISGKIVRKMFKSFSSPGSYFLKWNGKNFSDEEVSSGVYLYIFTSESVRISGKMVLVR